MRTDPPSIGQLAAVLLLLLARQASAQLFTDATAGLIEPASPCSAWADYDGDGDLDLLVAGSVAGTPTTILYKNTAGAFADSGIPFPGLEFASAAWGDYDNDGDLDLAMIGQDSTPAAMTRVYRNEGGTSFAAVGGPVPFSVGNNAAANGPNLDGWLSNMVIDESQTYTNFSGSPESIRIDTFSFYARAEANLLTPFVVRINGDNDFTVLAVGTTRSGADYDVGANSLPFSSGASPVVVLAAGQTLAVGFTDANADGSGGGVGAVIPFTSGGSEIWYSGGPGANDSGSVMVGSPPSPGVATFTTSFRTYHFNIAFSILTGSFTDVVRGDLAWGDYDSDGDLDLVVTGITEAPPAGTEETRLYRNDGGSFTSIAHPFPHVYLSAVAWGDHDDDGDLDLVITGATDVSIDGGLFRNDAGNFTDAGAGLTATQMGFAEWADYDNDGDLDLLLGGVSTMAAFGVTKLYKNTAGVLSEIATALPGMLQSSAAWGDYDNDGDLDIVLNGFQVSMPVSVLYRNDSGTFVNSTEVFPAVFSGAVAWGDSNNDGDLDLLLGGHLSTPVDTLKLFNNGIGTANTAPAAPANLISMVQDGSVSLSWDAASDGAQTPAAGLTYAIRVGTTMGGSDILSSGSAPSGYRRLPSPGSTQAGLMISLVDLAPGTYYWSVQAVDSGYLGSTFASEQSFTVMARPEVVSVVLEPGDVIHVIWSGTPGCIYHVQESTTLAPASWMLKSTPTADMTTGLFEMSEVISVPERFYRAARP